MNMRTVRQQLVNLLQQKVQKGAETMTTQTTNTIVSNSELSQGEQNMNTTANKIDRMAYYRKVRAAAKAANLSTTGKLDELIARLTEAGVPVPPREEGVVLVEEPTPAPEPEPVVIEPAKPEPITLANVEGRLAADRADALLKIRQGEDFKQRAKLAEAALRQIEINLPHVEAIGSLISVDPGAHTRITELRAKGETMVIEGQEDLAWVDYYEDGLASFAEGMRRLRDFDVVMPPEVLAVIHYRKPAGRKTETSATIVEPMVVPAPTPRPAPASTIDWMEDDDENAGLNDLPTSAKEALEEEEDLEEWLTDQEDEIEDEGQEETPAPSPKTFIFNLDGEEYEGRCAVSAIDIIEAKQKVLASDVLWGTRWTENEFDPGDEEKIKALLAMVTPPNGTPSTARGYGHYITVTVAA